MKDLALCGAHIMTKTTTNTCQVHGIIGRPRNLRSDILLRSNTVAARPGRRRNFGVSMCVCMCVTAALRQTHSRPQYYARANKWPRLPVTMLPFAL